MVEYKKGKVPEIVREFDNTGNRYEINGINQNLAKFFWREENKKFKIINNGSYRIVQEGGNYYLLIEDSDILSKASQFQICYFFEQLSSKYLDKFPDLAIAVEKINNIVDDIKNIYSYLKSTGVTGDTTAMSKVLSELEDQCVWWLNNGEIESLPVSDMYAKFDELVSKLYETSLTLLKADIPGIENEIIKTVTDAIKKISDNIAYQMYDIKLPLNQKIISLPNNWIMSERLTVHINGLLLTKGDDYTVNKIAKTITLQTGYSSIADVHVEDMLPTTYVEQLRDELIQIIQNAKNDIQTSTDQNLAEIVSKGNEYLTLLLQQGETSKQIIITQEGVSVKVLKSQEQESINNIEEYVTNTSLPAIDKYIEDNKAMLKGEKGDKGDIGPQGPQGPQGANGAVTEVKGFIGFQIKNGDLYVSYTGDEAPNFSINSNGELIYTV